MMQCLNCSENSGSGDSLTSNFSQAEALKWATEYRYGSIPSVTSGVCVIYSLQQYRFYPLIISNKSTNQMQQFFRFITRRLCTAQHVWGVLAPIIRSSTTAVAACGFTVGTWW